MFVVPFYMCDYFLSFLFIGLGRAYSLHGLALPGGDCDHPPTLPDHCQGVLIWELRVCVWDL